MTSIFDEQDPKFNFAYTQFMTLLVSTTEDLAKSFLALGGENKEISFGRVQKMVDKELQGDKLSIIKKTAQGYLVKKDGISGWYNGIIDYKIDDCK